MDQPPRCKHYDAKNPQGEENCQNCLGWLSILCDDYLVASKEYEAKLKMSELDRIWSNNKGVGPCR